MINRRTFIILLVALGLGVMAALTANQWVQSRLSGGDQQDKNATTVASLEIPFGKRIEESDIRLVSIPEEAVPSGSFARREDVVGRIASQTIYPGEVIHQGKAVEHLQGSSLAAVIKPDHRAVTVRVNDVIGVAGFLLPGNRVDVIASRKNRNREASSKILLRNKKVLAVDQTASPERNEPVIVRAVTLELTPDEAEKLVEATEEGSLQMALRNPNDRKIKVADKPEPKPEPKRAARTRSWSYITIIRGVDSENLRVQM